MINLKRNGFREQMFDDPMVDKEVFIRSKIMKIFNKRLEDFRNEFLNYQIRQLKI